MIQIADKTDENDAKWLKRLDMPDVRLIVVHRISLAERAPGNLYPIFDSALDAKGLRRVFLDRKMGTGGKPPYHWLIRVDGEIEQVIPLSSRGAHARGVNRVSWGVAIAGDFRAAPVLSAQWTSLVGLCSALLPFVAAQSSHPMSGCLVGHDEVRKHPKGCPGRYLHLSKLRREVLARVARDGLADLLAKTNPCSV